MSTHASGSEQIDWSQFLPTKPLPNTGHKKFVVGQIWATYSPGHDPTVRRVVKRDGDSDYFIMEVLAGADTSCGFPVSESSLSADYSQLVKGENETILQVDVVPQWARVTERIMTKAREHLDAGRANDFVQVFVPMDDYRALKDHLRDEPILWTAIGPVTVHPVNPDGATFSD